MSINTRLIGDRQRYCICTTLASDLCICPEFRKLQINSKITTFVSEIFSIHDILNNSRVKYFESLTECILMQIYVDIKFLLKLTWNVC